MVCIFHDIIITKQNDVGYITTVQCMKNLTKATGWMKRLVPKL